MIHSIEPYTFIFKVNLSLIDEKNILIKYPKILNEWIQVNYLKKQIVINWIFEEKLKSAI